MKKEKTVSGEIVWDKKGKPLFAIIPMEFDINSRLCFIYGNLVVDCEADNTSSEELAIKNGKIVEVV